MAMTEGLAGRGHEFPIAHYGAINLQPLSQLSLTAPLAQGSYGAFRIRPLSAAGHAVGRDDAPRQSLPCVGRSPLSLFPPRGRF